MSFVNRRRHERYVVTERVVVVIEARQELHTGTLVNVCESGCYAATSGTLPKGERLVLLVSLPGSSERSLRFACMVAWRNDGQAVFAHEGYGLEFLHDPRTLRNARELLRELGARGALVRITPREAPG
jgi:Tfp pilus assembly protein PilZ